MILRISGLVTVEGPQDASVFALRAGGALGAFLPTLLAAFSAAAL